MQPNESTLVSRIGSAVLCLASTLMLACAIVPAQALAITVEDTQYGTLDSTALADGTYTVDVKLLNQSDTTQASMAADAINNTDELIVKDGGYTLQIKMGSVQVGSLTGELGALSYYPSYTISGNAVVAKVFDESGQNAADVEAVKVWDSETDSGETAPLPVIEGENAFGKSQGIVLVEMFVPAMGYSPKAVVFIDWETLKAVELETDDADDGSNDATDETPSDEPANPSADADADVPSGEPADTPSGASEDKPADQPADNPADDFSDVSGDPTPDDADGQQDGGKTIVANPEKWKRLFGDNALLTMKDIVEEGWADGSADSVIVATNDGYWDALTASALAGVKNAPVLLTDKRALSSETRAQIRRLGASTVYIVGGTAALAESVEQQINAMSGVKAVRLAGATADVTATAIAKQSLASEKSDTVVIATINGYYDALSIAPYAYAKGAPVLLTDFSLSLSADTVKFIKGSGFSKAVIVGGTAAVSGNVEAQLASAGIASANITRLQGNDAWRTSDAIAKWEVESQGMTADNMGVADGCGYWDALTGAPLCGKLGSVLVLVPHEFDWFHYDRYCIDNFVKPHASEITNSYVFGGESVVPPSTLADLKAATA